MMRFVLSLALLATTSCYGQDAAPLAQRGEALAAALCAQCHAVGRESTSPLPGAPAFRGLQDRLDLDDFLEGLREGLTTAHEDMPTFRFGREDARAIVAYLRSIRGP